MQTIKKYIIWIVLGLLVIWAWASYNSLAKGEQRIKEQWGNVKWFTSAE